MRGIKYLYFTFCCRRCLEEGLVETVLQRGWDWTQREARIPSSVIWVSHLVQEEVWTRQLELGCDVPGLSSRSYHPFWQLKVHHILWRERFLGHVSRVCWHMGLRHGQWRLIAWREESVWWWGGYMVCLWKIGSQVRSCTVFRVFRAGLRWWGGGDWDGLGMWNARVEMIGCQTVEMWGWWGEE